MCGFGCVGIGLAVAMLAMAVSPAALAVAEEPKPDALWEAFPLEPTPERPASTPVPTASERPASPLLPPSQGRSEATTVTDAPSEASGPGIIVVAFAATLLLLVATVGVLSGKRLYVSKRHRRTVPLWQGAALPPSSDKALQLTGSGARASSGPVRHERGAAEPPSYFLAPLYRWVEVDKPPVDRPHPSIGSENSTLIHRFRKTVSTEEIAVAVIVSAAAVVMSALLVYLIG